MDPFHERLARVGLRAAGQYGFALAGGYAIQAHGFLDRLSADVDLFAPSSVEADRRPADRETWGGESHPGPLGMKVLG